ncbi:MAG TPA: patatin-like phospholipase family protein, partial [Acidimicrobiales bacterium]|nr:patatin-like phospholipase family protein [Acidimicrobiales bacterium]
ATSLPRATAAWLSPRAVDDVFHVRDGVTGDIDRVARVLSSRAVSIVLSGGGPRGFAHIGVLRAVRELDIPIDFIAGSSIGSVIAAVAAQGLADDDTVATAKESFHKIMNWTLPIVSMISGKRIAASIVRQFGGIGIEDLWVPYFCVSTSLTRAQAVVHRRGPLGMAIRASVAIPGLLPPVPFGDDLLVDGGVIHNLPVPESRRDNPKGLVVAVDVAPPGESPPRVDYGLSISGWAALRAMIRGRSRPSMLHETVLGSMLIASTRDRDSVVAEGLADLYLLIDAQGCGPFDWEAVERVADAGYASTRETLTAWVDEVGAPWVMH